MEKPYQRRFSGSVLSKDFFYSLLTFSFAALLTYSLITYVFPLKPSGSYVSASTTSSLGEFSLGQEITSESRTLKILAEKNWRSPSGVQPASGSSFVLAEIQLFNNSSDTVLVNDQDFSLSSGSLYIPILKNDTASQGLTMLVGNTVNPSEKIITNILWEVPNDSLANLSLKYTPGLLHIDNVIPFWSEKYATILIK